MKTIAEAKQFVEAQLGTTVTIIPNSELVVALTRDDFDAVLPTANVRSLDSLQDMVLTLSEKDGVSDQRTFAKHLVDGIWARARSIAYSAQTRDNKKLALAAQKAAEDRLKYEKMLKDNPKLAEDQEQLLTLQRSYGIIDQATYLLLLNNYRDLQSKIRQAQDAAAARVVAEHKKSA